jgi:hypothetical protein
VKCCHVNFWALSHCAEAHEERIKGGSFRVCEGMRHRCHAVTHTEPKIGDRRENEPMVRADEGEEHRRPSFLEHTIQISVPDVEIWSLDARGIAREVGGGGLGPLRLPAPHNPVGCCPEYRTGRDMSSATYEEDT